MQNELPLLQTLFDNMGEKPAVIGWRRAHRRTTTKGRQVRVALVITNSDSGPMEELLNKQLPDAVRKPLPRKRQICLDLDEDQADSKKARIAPGL